MHSETFYKYEFSPLYKNSKITWKTKVMGHKINVYFALFPVLLSPLFKAFFRWIPKKNPNPKTSFWFLEVDKIFSGKEFKVTDFYTKILIYATITCN